jgi:5-methylcytosine-specific restriction endonuclease McrA
MTSVTFPEFSVGLPASQVDASLRQALDACDRAQQCAVLWFAEVQRRGLHRALGHASLQLYATVGLGFSDNRYWLFKRLADDLDRLSVLREAVEQGTVGWTKARQVARVATPETQAEWVTRAATTGRRELELQVKRARKRQPAAQLPLVAGPPRPVADPPVTISLRADGVQLARFEALVEKAHKLGLAPAGADRLDLVLAALESLVVAGAERRPCAAGPAARIVVHQCPDCERTTVTTSRGERRLAPAQVEALGCDARIEQQGKPNRATIKPSVRAAVLARDRHRCTTPGCRSAHFLEVHHVKPRSQGGSNRAGNLVTLCSRCHGFRHERSGALAPAQVERAQVERAQSERAQVGTGQTRNEPSGATGG